MSAGFEIFRYSPILECALLGFGQLNHKHTIRVMARFGALNQLPQTQERALIIRPNLSRGHPFL